MAFRDFPSVIERLSDIIAGLSWVPADSRLEPLKSVDLDDYDIVVAVGTLPSAFKDLGKVDLVRWSVPDISEGDFDVDRLYAQIREDVNELFDSLERSTDSADEGDK